MDKMKVSGIITTYKRDASLVERAVQSMLNQTYKLYEIIVIDDNANGTPFCSPVKEMCERLGVKYVKQDGNRGVSAARNLGVKKCKR